MNIINKTVISIVFSILSYKLIEKQFMYIKISKLIYFLMLFFTIFTFIYQIIKRIVNSRSTYNSLLLNKMHKNCKWIYIGYSEKIDYSSIKYLFIGDSHLEMYYHSLQYIFRKPTFHFLLYIWHIYYHNEIILRNMIKRFKSIEIIFVSFLMSVSIFNKTQEQLEIILSSYFNLLLKYSKKVIYIQDNPLLAFNPLQATKKGKYTFALGINASRLFLNINIPDVIVLDPFSLLTQII